MVTAASTPPNPRSYGARTPLASGCSGTDIVGTCGCLRYGSAAYFSMLVVLVALAPLGCNRKQPDPLVKSKKSLAYMVDALGGMMSRKAASCPGMMPAVESCSYMRNLVKNAGESAVTPVPDPVAIYVQAYAGGMSGQMYLFWIEERSDLSGIRIREFWPDGQLIEEVYVFPPAYFHRKDEYSADQDPWRLYYVTVPVQVRNDPAQRKNEAAWRAWYDGYGTGESSPVPILVANPTTGAKIFVSLLDKTGFEGRSVSLGWGAPSLFMN